MQAVSHLGPEVAEFLERRARITPHACSRSCTIEVKHVCDSILSLCHIVFVSGDPVNLHSLPDSPLFWPRCSCLIFLVQVTQPLCEGLEFPNLSFKLCGAYMSSVDRMSLFCLDVVFLVIWMVVRVLFASTSFRTVSIVCHECFIGVNVRFCVSFREPQNSEAVK